MQTAYQELERLRLLGFTVSIQGELLAVEPKSRVTAPVREAITAHRAGLLRFLQAARCPAAPSDIAERSAILEHDGGHDRQQADAHALAEFGFASWDDLAAVHRYAIRERVETLPRLEQYGEALRKGTLRFLTGEWFVPALKHGWDTLDLFGVLAGVPVRHEYHGLVPMLVLSPHPAIKLGSIEDASAQFRFRTGSVQTYPRLGLRQDLGVVSPWWDCPVLTMPCDAMGINCAGRAGR